MKDIQSIISQMTLEEKAALCTGASAWTTTPVERLGVPEMIVSDGPHGVRRVPDVHAMMMESLPATCFPTASCLASTWDVELIHKMGEALAEECIALNVDVLLGPGANMKRCQLYQWSSKPRRGYISQALCREQSGIPTLQHQRRNRRTHLARNLSDSV